MLLSFFFRLEAIYNRVLFKTLEEDKSIELSKNTVDFSVSVSLDSINPDTYRTSDLSNLFKELPSGHLIPLSCGHNGGLSQSEFEAYQNHLIQSNFIDLNLQL